jgi:hypothetical protein
MESAFFCHRGQTMQRSYNPPLFTEAPGFGQLQGLIGFLR